jgi:hypothetical protein
MKKNDNEYSHKLSYRIAHVFGAAAMSILKLIPLFRGFNIRLVLGIPALAMLLLMVYVEFLQNKDRNNELLYDALIPGKSTRDNFYAFKRAGGLENEPYWNGYSVNSVEVGYKSDYGVESFIIRLSRDPGNTKGISFETLKSDLEYLCGTEWWRGDRTMSNNGEYGLKHENWCIVMDKSAAAGYGPDHEYSVTLERQNRIK